MILKEIDNKPTPTNQQKAGFAAEKQMAHYLKRAFQDSKDIHIINDLRLMENDDVAQIDHLIFHRFGFIIVESKSVTTKLSVNDRGEWSRLYNKKYTGMASPTKQAERQANFLKKYLNSRSDILLKKAKIFQASMSNFKYDVLVAISDSGIINRDVELPEVHKADQIVDEINKIISTYAETNNKVLSLKMNYHFSDTTMDKVKRHLVQSHKPVNSVVNESKATYVVDAQPKRQVSKKIIANSVNDKTCGKCKSENIEILYGKFGYYFKCADCAGNTSIKLKCKDDACKVRLRKQKHNFFKECETCDTSELYFVNKVFEEV